MNSRGKLAGSSDESLLWLDYADYAAGLLAGGVPPWLDTTDCVAWLRKAQGLLKSDVIALPLDAVAQTWISAHADLRQAMAARTKVGYPLKTLLNDEKLRGYLFDLAAGLRASFNGAILALTFVAPGAWLEQAYRNAFGGDASVDIDEDAIDSASVYIADFLRVFGESGIDALLLDDTAVGAPVSDARLQLYQPIFNVCGHYRWEAGLLAPEGLADGMRNDLTFTVTRASASDARGLMVVPDAFWEAGDARHEISGKRLYARIPAGGTPEIVLQRLSALH
ncbi:hypothetical protein [Burkholderia multivorans]|uniref:hypothetical protein n=1 Tax=Burkholderia multivorans TaxID=87883 RepID=UPI0004F75C90|nr:hypothetical protein [Burkholderia multivorans]AIO73611.1 hypothetical protein DM80_3939 [Burkholderia multivorans]